MCTLEKRGNVYILTLTGTDDHRLNPTLISSIRSALATLHSHPPTIPTALITTATGSSFFSNGFDLKWATSQSTPTSPFVHHLCHMVTLFKPLIADLISLPMPTIAAVTGHAAAAGFALALSHDYFFMRGDKGVLYMSEIDIGMTLPGYFNVLFGEKLTSVKARRDVLLKAAKITAAQAVELGIVDSVYGSAVEVVEEGVRLGEELVKRKWKGEVYGEIRKGLYPKLCEELGLERKEVVVSML